MDDEKYNPVPYTREDDAKLFADPAFKAAWDALEEEYAALSKMIKARKQAGLKIALFGKNITLLANINQLG